MRKAACYLAIMILIFTMFSVVALADDAFKPSNATDAQTSVATITTLCIAAMFVVLVISLLVREINHVFSENENIWLLFLFSVVVAVVLRVFVAMSFEGYSTDIACFKGWAIAAYEQGLSNFYTSGMFADYPPGYMYVLYGCGWIRSLFNIESGSAVFTLIVKLPSFIAEVVTALIVFRIGKKQIGGTFGLLAGTLVLFNPAMFFNSSAWGQIDAVFILFILLTLLYLKRENYILGALFFAVALLIKPQAIMFAPVIGLAYIYALFKKGGFGKAIAGIFGGAAVFFATITAAVIPFTGSQEPLWIIDKYAGTVDFYPYTSLNAFNLFALIGGNFNDKNTPFLFADYATWGWVLIGVTCVLVIILQWRTRERRPMFELGAFLIVSVFMLAHAMHERYILPVSLLLIFAYVHSRDKSTLVFAAAFTLYGLAAQMVTLYADGVVVPPLQTTVLSVIGVALYAVYAVITMKKLSSGNVLIKSPAMHG